VPKISILLPAYNVAPYIRGAMESILSQSFKDFELLVFEDASTDETLDILSTFKDSRVRLLHSTVNRGYITHLNEGLLQAQGEYIARMDADDIAVALRLEKQCNYLDQNPEISVLGSDVYTTFEDGKRGPLWKYPETPEKVAARLLFHTSHAHPAVMFRRELVDKGLFRYDESFYSAEDYELWTRLAGQVRMANISLPLLYYRISKQQVSNVLKPTQVELSIKIRNAYVSRYRKFEHDNEEQLFSRFWRTLFQVDREDFRNVMHIYESIYLQSDSNSFQTELAEQIKTMVVIYSAYCRDIFSWYRESPFYNRAPLTVTEKAKNLVNRMIGREIDITS
jgi:glycosyltransferase involved in cell wall biosynthesis